MLRAVLDVARSGYYGWRKRRERGPSERERKNAELSEKVKAVFEKHKARYGSPRIHAELKKQQVTCSLGRVKRLMRREGLYATSNKKYRSKRERCDLETRNLLLEQPRPSAINQLWHVDITYIATAEGWELAPKGRALPVRALLSRCHGRLLQAHRRLCNGG